MVRSGFYMLAIPCLMLAGLQPASAYDNFLAYDVYDAGTRTVTIPQHHSSIIRDIEISGLKKTQPITVLRELPFTSGDTWHEEFKSTGERRLRNTGLFSEAVIAPPDADGVVRIWVRDRWSLFLLPEGSRSDIGKTSAGVTLTEHNMWGLNHNLRVALREETGKNFSALKGTTASGSYLWRRIGDGSADLSVSANAGRRVFDTFQNALLASQYREQNVGWASKIIISHGPVPGEGWSSQLGFSSSLSNFTLIAGPADPTVIDKHRNAIQAGVSYRFVDDRITWLTGTSFDYNWDVAHRGLGSNLNVYRQTSSLASHIPISDGGSTFDFRINGGGATGSVLQDGLFDIGNNSGLRGYLPGELQGTYYAFGNIEARIPIRPGSNFHFVGFTDIGQIWNLGKPALGKDLIVGVGAGARLTLRWLVKGTFRSDIAYGTATKRIRFYFGTQQAF